MNVVAITRDRELVLVRQHRYGIDAPTLEIPGGAVDPGEEPIEAALRELREETGYGGGRVLSLGWVWANPAIQDNRVWLFAVVDCERIGEPNPDPTESIEIEHRPTTQARQLIADGSIAHSLAVVAVQRALLDGIID